MSTEHYAVVGPDEARLAWIAERRPVTEVDREGEWAAHIECSDPSSCPGWQECQEDHEGFDPEDEDSPAYDQEEFEIHGEIHGWQIGWGWTLPYKGCPVVERVDSLDTGELDMTRPGRWLLGVDWDDTDCWISVVKEVEADE